MYEVNVLSMKTMLVCCWCCSLLSGVQYDVLELGAGTGLATRPLHMALPQVHNNVHACSPSSYSVWEIKLRLPSYWLDKQIIKDLLFNKLYCMYMLHVVGKLFYKYNLNFDFKHCHESLLSQWYSFTRSPIFSVCALIHFRKQGIWPVTHQTSFSQCYGRSHLRWRLKSSPPLTFPCLMPQSRWSSIIISGSHILLKNLNLIHIKCKIKYCIYSNKLCFCHDSCT